MKYEIPETRMPCPAVPTPEEALAAIQGTIRDVVGDEWKPIIQHAVADLIFTDLIEPLLHTAQTWLNRAVHRREEFGMLAHRWSAIRDLVLGNATPDEVSGLLKIQVANLYKMDGELPGDTGFGLYALLGLFDPDKLTPEQVDQLHIRRMHPRFEYDTTEGPRKQWDCEPPEGDGWELNQTSEDPEAWERFEYTEEARWRRLRQPQVAASASEEVAAG